MPETQSISSSTAGVTEASPSIWSRWPFWVLIVLVVGSLLGILQPMSLGHKPYYISPFGLLIWLSSLSAYIFKFKNRSIWLGLLLGIALAFLTLIMINIVFSALWTSGHIQPPK